MTWTLVIFVLKFGASDAIALSSVPGFTSSVQCGGAAIRVRDMIGQAGIVHTTCVEAGRDPEPAANCRAEGALMFCYDNGVPSWVGGPFGVCNLSNPPQCSLKPEGASNARP